MSAKNFRQARERLGALIIVFLLTHNFAIAGPDFDTAFEKLGSSDSKSQKQASKCFEAAGYPGAIWLSNKSVKGDEKRRAAVEALIAPYRNRMLWDSNMTKSELIFGKLTGFGLLLRKRVVSGEFTVLPCFDGGIQIAMKVSGKYQDDTGKVVAKSRYDKNMQLVFSEFSVVITDTKKQRKKTDEAQVWQKTRNIDAFTAEFRVSDAKNGEQRLVNLPRHAVTVDFALALGRSLNFSAKKLEKLDLTIVNPDDLGTIAGQLKTVRREKIVVSGGLRKPGLRIEASSAILPKALKTLAVWIDAEQRPLKLRVGPVSVYTRSAFKASSNVVSKSEVFGEIVNGTSTKKNDKENTAPKGKKPEFF